MNLILRNQQLVWDTQVFPCIWGRGGKKVSKAEGDGATPIGTFPFRRVFYRPDRLEKPETCLPLQALISSDGWCDDPEDPSYNQFVTKPHPGRHEDLWREDHLYDLILVVGYNDAPVEKNKGSAIFVHLSQPDKKFTQGCVALALKDLLTVVQDAHPQSALIVED